MTSPLLVFGVPVSSRGKLQLFLEDIENSLTTKRRLLVTFVNPHSVAICQKNQSYLENLKDFDRVFCDGIGMVIAARKEGVDVDRLSFDATSLSPIVFGLLADQQIAIYFVGGAPGISNSAAQVISKKFPRLKVKHTFSGYGSDPASSINLIANDGYSVVVVGLGVGKQEEYLLRLSNAGWTGIGLTCGGYFDQVGSSDRYYPIWIDKLNIRFLYRIFMEPRRLSRRYFIEYIPFLIKYLRTFL